MFHFKTRADAGGMSQHLSEVGSQDGGFQLFVNRARNLPAESPDQFYDLCCEWMLRAENVEMGQLFRCKDVFEAQGSLGRAVYEFIKPAGATLAVAAAPEYEGRVGDYVVNFYAEGKTPGWVRRGFEACYAWEREIGDMTVVYENRFFRWMLLSDYKDFRSRSRKFVGAFGLATLHTYPRRAMVWLYSNLVDTFGLWIFEDNELSLDWPKLWKPLQENDPSLFEEDSNFGTFLGLQSLGMSIQTIRDACTKNRMVFGATCALSEGEKYQSMTNWPLGVLHRGAFTTKAGILESLKRCARDVDEVMQACNAALDRANDLINEVYNHWDATRLAKTQLVAQEAFELAVGTHQTMPKREVSASFGECIRESLAPKAAANPDSNHKRFYDMFSEMTNWFETYAGGERMVGSSKRKTSANTRAVLDHQNGTSARKQQSMYGRLERNAEKNSEKNSKRAGLTQLRDALQYAVANFSAIYDDQAPKPDEEERPDDEQTREHAQKLVRHLKMFVRPTGASPGTLVKALDCWRHNESYRADDADAPPGEEYINPVMELYGAYDITERNCEGLFVESNQGRVPLVLAKGLYQRCSYLSSSAGRNDRQIVQEAVLPVPLDNPRYHFLVYRNGLVVDGERRVQLIRDLRQEDFEKSRLKVERLRVLQRWVGVFADTDKTFEQTAPKGVAEDHVEPWPIARVSDSRQLFELSEPFDILDVESALAVNGAADRSTSSGRVLSGDNPNCTGQETSARKIRELALVGTAYSQVFLQKWAARYGLALRHKRLPSVFFIQPCKIAEDVKKLRGLVDKLSAPRKLPIKRPSALWKTRRLNDDAGEGRCLRITFEAPDDKLRELSKLFLLHRKHALDGCFSSSVGFMCGRNDNDPTNAKKYVVEQTISAETPNGALAEALEELSTRPSPVVLNAQRKSRYDPLKEHIEKLFGNHDVLTVLEIECKATVKKEDCDERAARLCTAFNSHFFNWFFRLLMVRGHAAVSAAKFACPLDVESVAGVYDIPVEELTPDGFVKSMLVPHAWRAYVLEMLSYAKLLFASDFEDPKHAMALFNGVPVGVNQKSAAEVLAGSDQEIVVPGSRHVLPVGEVRHSLLVPKMQFSMKFSNSSEVMSLPMPMWIPSFHVEIDKPVYCGRDIFDPASSSVLPGPDVLKKACRWILGIGEKNRLQYDAVDANGEVVKLVCEYTNVEERDKPFYLTTEPGFTRFQDRKRERNVEAYRVFFTDLVNDKKPLKARLALPFNPNVDSYTPSPRSENAHPVAFPNFLIGYEQASSRFDAFMWPGDAEQSRRILKAVEDGDLYAVAFDRTGGGRVGLVTNGQNDLKERGVSTVVETYRLPGGQDCRYALLCATDKLQRSFKMQYHRALLALGKVGTSADQAFLRVMLTTRLLMLSLCNEPAVDATMNHMTKQIYDREDWHGALWVGLQELNNRLVGMNNDRQRAQRAAGPQIIDYQDGVKISYVQAWKFYREETAAENITAALLRLKNKINLGAHDALQTHVGRLDTIRNKLKSSSRAYPYVSSACPRDKRLFQDVFEDLVFIAQASLIAIIVAHRLISFEGSAEELRSGIREVQNAYAALEDKLEVLTKSKSFSHTVQGDASLKIFYDCCAEYSTLVDSEKPMIVEEALALSCDASAGEGPPGLQNFETSISTVRDHRERRPPQDVARTCSGVRTKSSHALASKEIVRNVEQNAREDRPWLIKKPCSSFINVEEINWLLNSDAPPTRKCKRSTKIVSAGVYPDRLLEPAYVDMREVQGKIIIDGVTTHCQVKLPRYPPTQIEPREYELSMYDNQAMYYATVLCWDPSIKIQVDNDTTIEIQIFGGSNAREANFTETIKLQYGKNIYDCKKTTEKIWVAWGRMHDDSEKNKLEQIQIYNTGCWGWRYAQQDL